MPFSFLGGIFGCETDDGLSRVFFKQRNAGSAGLLILLRKMVNGTNTMNEKVPTYPHTVRRGRLFW